jgi:hypothetical protein
MRNAMVSMELEDEDKLDCPQPFPMPSKPDYPYGLRITLGEKELEKLGLDFKEAFVGGLVHLHAMARVTSTSENKDNGSESCRIELQIEDLCIESEDDENRKGEPDGSSAKPARHLPRRGSPLYRSDE